MDTSSDSAHFGIPRNLHWKMQVKLLKQFSFFPFKLFGIPKCALSLDISILCFIEVPDDDSLESKHVAICIIYTNK